MWDKRIPKNEILMMDLAQNIFMLRQAVRDDRVKLQQALKIIVGLQKLYQRLLTYLYEDSQCILAELEDPFKEVKDEPQVKTELNINENNENNKSKKRIKKDDGKAYNPATLKLDLKNSKWWHADFDNEYLKEQLNKFIQSKSNDEEKLLAEANEIFEIPKFAQEIEMRADLKNAEAISDFRE